MAGVDHIILDRGIRSFVLIPIAFVVIAMSFIRMKLLALLKTDTKVVMKELKNNSALARCQRLMQGRNILSESAWKTRTAYFLKKDVGVLMKPPPAKDPMQALGGGGDPTQAMGMMKNQFVFMILQGLLGYWVSHLFSGFLVAKTPFPLTFRFKPMMQRGVDVSSLDVSYISALSWYFIVMFCSSGFMQLCMSWKTNGPIDPNASTEAMMQGMMPGMQMGGGMGAPDPAKLFEDAKNNLTIAQREWFLNDAEGKLLKRWKGGDQYVKPMQAVAAA